MPREVTGKIQLTPPFFRGIVLLIQKLIMAIKLVLLKSNEEVIANVQAKVNENDEVVRIVFENPFICRLVEAPPEILMESEKDIEDKYTVQFSPWMPLSKDKIIELDPSWIVTLTEPNEWILESYNNKMNSTTEGSINEDIPISPTELGSVEVLSE